MLAGEDAAAHIDAPAGDTTDGAGEQKQISRPAAGGCRIRNDNGKEAAAGEAEGGQHKAAGTDVVVQQQAAAGKPAAAAATSARQCLQPAVGDDLLRANTSDEDEEEGGACDEGVSARLQDGLAGKPSDEDDVPEKKEAIPPKKRCCAPQLPLPLPISMSWLRSSQIRPGMGA